MYLEEIIIYEYHKHIQNFNFKYLCIMLLINSHNIKTNEI